MTGDSAAGVETDPLPRLVAVVRWVIAWSPLWCLAPVAALVATHSILLAMMSRELAADVGALLALQVIFVIALYIVPQPPTRGGTDD